MVLMEEVVARLAEKGDAESLQIVEWLNELQRLRAVVEDDLK